MRVVDAAGAAEAESPLARRSTARHRDADRFADAEAVLARLQEIVAARQVASLKSKLQRINPQDAPEEHARLSGELFALEMHRIRLRERASGGE